MIPTFAKSADFGKNYGFRGFKKLLILKTAELKTCRFKKNNMDFENCQFRKIADFENHIQNPKKLRMSMLNERPSLPRKVTPIFEVCVDLLRLANIAWYLSGPQPTCPG